MNKTASKILNKYLGEWIENLNSDQLDISLFSGKILLENLALKKDVFHLLGLPFELKYCRIGKIRVKIPWGALLSKPLEIEITEVYAYITPNHPSTWSEANIRESIQKSKNMLLDKFEAMKDYDNRAVDSPGLLKKWLTKIIENVQLVLEKVYIRYEDEVTGSLKYSIGVVLEKLTADTCDFNWVPKYVEESQLCYKLLKVSSLFVFCDHNTETVIFSNFYQGETCQAFENLALDEFAFKVIHNFILMPYKAEIQAVISKEISIDYPIINAQISSNSLTINFYTDHIKAVLKLLELLKLYNFVRTGISKALNERDFLGDELEVYQKHYEKWLKVAENSKKSEKVRNLMSEIESKILTEKIIQAREEKVAILNKKKLVDKKIKEIENLNKKNTPFYANIKGFFHNLTKTELNQLKTENNAKISNKRQELEDLLSNNQETIEPKTYPEWIRAIIMISISQISISFMNENSMLVLIDVNGVTLALGIKEALFLDFQIVSLVIKDYVKRSQFFPNFFESNHFTVSVQESPLKVCVTGGEIYVYCLVESLLTIFNILMSLLENEIDVVYYKNQIAEKYKKQLEAGQQYLKMIVNEGKIVPISLDLNIKAPIFILPTNANSNSALVVIDLGTINWTTSIASENFLMYNINLSNFAIFIVWQWKVISQWRNGIKDNLFGPITINTTASINLDLKNPNLELIVAVDQTSFMISPMILSVLSEIKDKSMILIPKLFLHKKKKIPSSQVLTKKDKNIGKIFPMTLAFVVHSITLQINEMSSTLCSIEIYDIRGSTQVNSLGNTKIEANVKTFSVKDKRKDTFYENVIENPYCSEVQISAVVNLDSFNNFSDIGIAVYDLRIVANASFAYSLINLYNYCSQAFTIPQLNLSLGDPNYFIDSISNLRISLVCYNIEVWVPNEENSGVLSFSLSTSCIYTACIYSKIVYSVYNWPLDTHYFYHNDEIHLFVNNAYGKIRFEGLANDRFFIYPCRGVFSFDTQRADTNPLTVINSLLDLETLNLQISIKDLVFLYSLLNYWNKIPIPVFSLSIFKLNIRSNCIKLTLSDYISNNFLDLFVLKLNKVNLNFFEDQSEDKILLQIGLSLDYYNNKYSALEPALEKWVLIASAKYKDYGLSVDLQSKLPLNINFTYHLLELLTKTSKKLENSEENFEKKQTHQKIEYILENKLGIPITAWLSIGKDYEKWEIKENSSQVFTDELINKLNASINTKVKWNSLMAFVRPPTILSFTIAGQTKEYQITVEEVSKKVYKVFDGEFEFPCFIHNFSQENQRIIRFEPGLFIANNYDEPHSFSSVSIQDIKSIENLKIKTQAGLVSIKENLVYKENIPLIVEIHEYEVDTKEKLNVAEINPLYSIKNTLVHDVCVLSQNLEIQRIQAGQTEKCEFDPTLKYFLKLLGTSEILSKETVLFKEKNFFVELDSIKEASVAVKTYKNNYKAYSNFSLADCNKLPKNEKLHSWVIEIYSEYLFINKTQQGLNLSGMVLPLNEVVYYSKAKSSKMKVKLSNLSSDWSEKFRIDTIGMSGSIKILSKTDSKIYVLGMSISQGFGYMANTKIVTFLPRFMIWNFTDIMLTVKQNENNGVSVPKSSNSMKISTVFYLDNIENSKIKVSNDSLNWSAGFYIENLDDFQIKFISDQGENEKDLNVFERKWYVPCEENKFVRVVRVLIHTENEATIHISFLNPNSPDFKIINKSNQNIRVSQENSENFYELLSFASLDWVWDDVCPKKKKVQLSSNEITQLYSLEKVKDYKNKDFNDCSVSILINGTTRELWIKSKDFIQANSLLADNFPNYLMLKDGNQAEVLNPRFAAAGSIVPMKDLVNSMDSKFLQSITKEFKIALNVKIKEIGLAVVDKDQTECFFISFKKVKTQSNLRIFTLDRKKKIESQVNLTIEHFQIDNIGSDPDVFPVILYPINKNHEAEEKGKKYFFFMLEMDHMMIISPGEDEGTNEIMQKFENFEVAFSEMSLNIHEETIYKVLNLRYFLELIKPTSQQKILNFVNEDPFTISFNPHSIQSKSYFRFFKLRALKVIISIKQTTKNFDIRFITDSPLLSVARVVAGAFANITLTPFHFKEIFILNAFQSSTNLASVLVKTYIRQAIIQFYKILGSIDLIGNPLNLIQKIGLGVFEFFAAPAKGLIGGPKSFAVGLGKGVRSLLSGVVSGSFDSIHKVTGTLYEVLKRATDDENQLKTSENIAKNMIIGIGQGFLDIINGFTHVVIRPYHGAKNNGTKGFFKEVLIGTVGFITAPIKFVLKIGSTLSLTISATTDLVLNGKLKKHGRARFPRFFGPKKILQSYNYELSSIKALLSKFQYFNKQIIIYYFSTIVEQSEIFYNKKNLCVILTSNVLLYLVDGELFKAVEIMKIKCLEVHSFKDLYFLCLATDEVNFSIPSKSFAYVEGVYNLIVSINSQISTENSLNFEAPLFIDKKALSIIENKPIPNS